MQHLSLSISILDKLSTIAGGGRTHMPTLLADWGRHGLMEALAAALRSIAGCAMLRSLAGLAPLIIMERLDLAPILKFVGECLLHPQH